MGKEEVDLAAVPLEALALESKKRIFDAGLGLLTLGRDLYDSLTVGADSIPHEQDRSDVLNLLDALIAFTDSHIDTVIARPRTVRENDRVVLLPGQHSGVTVQYINRSGEVAFVNLYGGLRDAESGYEIRDGSGIYLRKSDNHASRTDEVLSQPTQFNVHLRERTRGFTIGEFWGRYHLNQRFGLSMVSWYGSRVNYSTTVDYNAPQFEDLNMRFMQNARNLLALVPSA